MCASCDLSRTYPTSLSQNWDFSPCPSLSPAPGKVVQGTSYGHRGICSVPGRTIAVIPPSFPDRSSRTDRCRWAVLSPVSQPFPPGSTIVPLLGFPDKESSEYCHQLRTSSCRGRSAGQERRRRTPLPKEEEGPLRGGRAVPAKGCQLPMKTLLCCVKPLAFRPGFPIPLPTSP